MNEPNIVILAGGISSRMKKATEGIALDGILLNEATRKSKAMLSVGAGQRPFLDYVLYNIEQAGYEDVVIVVGEYDDSIREFYENQNGKQQFQKLRISYGLQIIPAGRIKPFGTADALVQALNAKPEWREQSFTVCNSDNVYSAEALIQLRETKYENAMIDYNRAALQFPPERIKQFAVITKDEEGFLTNIIEKPTLEDVERVKEMNGRIGVSMNIFRLNYSLILPFLESVPLHPVRNEKELPVAVKMMVEQHPRSMFCIPLSEHVPDLTSRSDILIVKEYLKNFQLQK
ncbi:MAG: NTP transferase domain-containing protein [Ignavibacteriae bacterium]|nr:NTP transferase domain-containing protein [Ignavibacteriota bacterium]